MPLGMGLIRRVAVWAKTMMPAATIQVTSIEFVSAKWPNCTSGAAFSGTPSCSTCAGAAVSAANAELASATPHISARIDISK
jgi:hypothetical protein